MLNKQRTAWLVVLPPALGDSVLSFTVIDKIRAAKGGSVDIYVAALPDMAELVNEAEGICKAFPYGEVGRLSRVPYFEWVIDLSGLEYHRLLGDRSKVGQVIYRSTSRWESVIVELGSGVSVVPEIMDVPNTDGSQEELPVWFEEAAPLLARVLGASLADWLCDRAGPRILLKDRRWPLKPRESASEIMFLPCGAWDAKKWPEERWLALAGMLLSDGFKVGLVLGPNERGDYTRLRQKVHHTFLPDNYVGLAGVLARGTMVIANDCGPLHLAAAIGLRCVAIFGPTNPNKWFWYHNQRQTFIQTTSSLQAALAAGWKVDRNGKWNDWPGEQQVYDRIRNMLPDPRAQRGRAV